jgi:hypothetical protein
MEVDLEKTAWDLASRRQLQYLIIVHLIMRTDCNNKAV